MSKLVNCPSCKDGKILVTVNEIGAGGKKAESQVELTCVQCDGSAKITALKAAAIKAFNDAWCKCAGDVETRYHGDTPAMKHHWTCNACGGIVQIG